MNDARLLGIAGGGGGQGGVATTTDTNNHPGGDGGDAGQGWGSSSSHGDFKYKPGSDGDYINFSGSGIDNSSIVDSGTAKGGNRPGTTAVRHKYAMDIESVLREFVGASADNTPVGADAGNYDGTGSPYYYRGGGGGGGSGYAGGASGAPGMHGKRFSRSSGGGGGGSSAYRYQNLPPGILELDIGNLISYGLHNGDADNVAIHSTHDGRNEGL